MMAKKLKVNEGYNASSIKGVKGLDAVRKFPGMYIGNIGLKGVFHLFREVIDNSLDENKAGFCDEIFVDINEKTNKIVVSDSGRGIPTEKIEEVICELHTSGKYEGENYKESIGLHGVGLKAVNALSDELNVIVSRDGKKYNSTFSKGKILTKNKVIGETKETGTHISFHPDVDILEDIDIVYDDYYKYCETIVFFYPGLSITFHATTREGKEINKEFKSKNGIIDYVRYLEKQLIINPIKLELHEEEKGIDVALSYRKSGAEEVHSYCNGVNTVEGGEHERGFRQGLTTTILKYIKDNKLLTKKDEKLEITGDDVRNGLIAIVVVRHSKPQFGGQHKGRLLNSDVSGISKKVVTEKFLEYLNANPNEAKKLCGKVILAAKARIKAKQVQEVESKKSTGFASLNSLSKYVPCTSNNPDECELFIVEGRL